MKNYLLQANLSTKKRITNKERVLAAMDDCRSLFWSVISPIFFITEQEFLKVYDYYDDNHLMRFKTKKYMNSIQKEFNRFHSWVSANYDSKSAAVPYDLANKIYGGLQKEILDLYLTFRFYFERKKVDATYPKVQVQLTMAMFDCWKSISDTFFEKYQKDYNINFRGYFEFANLDKAYKMFNRFYFDLVKPEKYEDFKPSQNYASIKAFEAFAEKLTNCDFLDEQAIDVLTMNNCVEELAEIYGDNAGLMKNATIIRKIS